MSALGKLFRTTAFKLSLAYLVVFTIFAFFLLGYVAWDTRRVLTDQIIGTIEAEFARLGQPDRVGGLLRLVSLDDEKPLRRRPLLVPIVGRASRQPVDSLSLVTTPTGEGVDAHIGRPAP